MPLFLITGLPGSGKSTVCAELKTRGYEAYDGDTDRLAKWFNDATGQPVESEVRERTPEFLSGHSRDIARGVVEDLKANAGSKPVFLCGDPENEAELNDLFSQVFALIIDEETRDRRLVARTNNNWGKLPHEREYSRIYGKKWDTLRERLDYVSIDSTQPVKDIADQILEIAGLS